MYLFIYFIVSAINNLVDLRLNQMIEFLREQYMAVRDWIQASEGIL
jgi:hypothetical protein